MPNKYGLLTLLLLLAVLPAAAGENVRQTGCRRGTPLATSSSSAHIRQWRRSVHAGAYVGDRRQLVILAAFSDRSFEGDSLSTLLTWEKIFNQQGFQEESFVGSVHDYFYDQSYGQFRLSFDLHYMTMGSASRYASTSADDERSQYLVLDILDSLNHRDIPWGDYDWEGDGMINQLLIVYAGKGMNDGGGSNTIWPHQWWLSKHIVPGTKDTRCGARTVSDGVNDYTVDAYCAVQEVGVNHHSFGTICHEYSHCFGFPDFYNGATKYVGSWDLMDSGNYNGGGYVPCGYSAHERWLLGWLAPIEVDSTTTVTAMPALNQQAVAYLLRNDGYEDEYYIVEHRRQEGWDSDVPGQGIVVFHVDYDEAIWNATVFDPVNSEAKTRYTIFHANDRSVYYAGGWAYPYEDNRQLTNTSSPAATLNNPNRDSTYLMSKPITDMAVSDGKASFTVTVSHPTAIREVTAKRQFGEVLYDFGRIRIFRDRDGKIKKVVKR